MGKTAPGTNLNMPAMSKHIVGGDDGEVVGNKGKRLGKKRHKSVGPSASS